MNSPDLQTLAAIVTIIGGLLLIVHAPLEIVDTALEIYKKIAEILERRKSDKASS